MQIPAHHASKNLAGWWKGISATSVAACAIMAMAAALRLWPVAAGLPYSDYIDEGYVLNQTIDHINRRTYDCDYYNYPPLPSYLATAAMLVSGPIYRWTHGHGFRKDLPRESERMTPVGHNYNLIAPAELILVSRIVVVILSLGTVALAGMVARASGGPLAGLLAMLACAVCPALVTRGSTMIVDSVATFFVLLTVYFAERLRHATVQLRNDGINAALAGIAAAFAFDSKYTAGGVMIVVVISIAVARLSWRAKTWLIGISAVSFLFAAIAAAPGLVLQWGKVVTELRLVSKFYHAISLPTTYWQAALADHELGLLLIILGLIGFGLMLCVKTTRMMAIGWLAFAALLIIPLVGYKHQPIRNFLPLVPLLCIAAALGVGLVTKVLRPGWFSTAVQVAAAITVLYACGYATRASVGYARDRVLHVDTRVRAIDWLRSHVRPTDRILGIRELIVLPLEWKRVPAYVEVVSWFHAPDRLQQEQFDYVVTGNVEVPANSSTNPDWLRAFDGWSANEGKWQTVATFGGGGMPIYSHLWRGTEEQVRILRNPISER